MELPSTKDPGVTSLLKSLRINGTETQPYIAGSFQDIVMGDRKLVPGGKRRSDERLTQSANDLRRPKRASSPGDVRASTSVPPSRSESRTDLSSSTSSVIYAPSSPIDASTTNANGLSVATHQYNARTHSLDPSTQIHGLNNLRTQLENYILPVLEGEDLLPDRGDQHMFWSTTPYGSGVFTLVDNFCRYHGINMLHVSTRAPRNNLHYCLDVTYDDGRYRSIMNQALTMAPCILFIDRIDPHFSVYYETIGLQLADQWDVITAASGGGIPKVWTVISSSDSVADLFHKWPINPYARFARWETVRSPLSAAHCAEILMNSIDEQIISRNIQVDDRPAPPIPDQNGAIPEDEKCTYEDALENSTFAALLRQKRTSVDNIARTLHNTVTMATPKDAPAPFCVEPWWLHTAVVDAFRAATERYRSIKRMNPSGVPPPRVMLVPTDQDLLESLRRLPTPLVKSLKL